jgi:hypothetical protein
MRRTKQIALEILSLLATQLLPWPARGASQAVTLKDLAWLAGCWERRTPAEVVSEQWMRPEGGLMTGMSRTVRGKSVEFEFQRIFERDGALVYAAQPSGAAAVEFMARSSSPGAIRFENPAHDFPQRIIYQRGTADSLFARIEGESNGRTTGIDYRLARVRCAD